MINLGVRYLLPSDWKAFAWIDADVEFESEHWARDALCVLQKFDVVQLFSHCLDMDDHEVPMSIFSSFTYQYTKYGTYSYSPGFNYWHPGYAWACTRSAYEVMGGLLERAILGSGDYNMASCLIGRGSASFAAKTNTIFQGEVLAFQERVFGKLTLSYVPGVIRHYFHGSKINRKYVDRTQILIKHDFNPAIHLTYDSVGVLIPTPECPAEFLWDIWCYFLERNEDE
jgi:hypothetical protein